MERKKVLECCDLYKKFGKKEILKGNGLTNIDELMDSKFGKPGTPEREKFRKEASTYVYEHTKTAECKNSQKKRK